MIDLIAKNRVEMLARFLFVFLHRFPPALHQLGSPDSEELLVGSGRHRVRGSWLKAVRGSWERLPLALSLVIHHEVLERVLEKTAEPAALRIGPLEIPAYQPQGEFLGEFIGHTWIAHRC